MLASDFRRRPHVVVPQGGRSLHADLPGLRGSRSAFWVCYGVEARKPPTTACVVELLGIGTWVSVMRSLGAK